MAERVTTLNLFSEVRNNVISLLRNSVIDPKRGTTNSKRRWIYREFPDTTSKGFDEYPILVVKSPSIDNEEIQELKGCLTLDDLNISVEIYVEYNDEFARVDALSNSVYHCFRTYANRKNLSLNNLDVQGITASDFDNIEEEGKELSTRTFYIPFMSALEN